MSSKYDGANQQGEKEVPSFIAPESAKDREGEGSGGGAYVF